MDKDFELPKLDELYAQQRALKDLLESRGWELLTQIAHNQIASRRSFFRRPLEDGGKVYEQEFVKGEAVGIETFLSLPKDLLASLEQDIEMAKAQLNMEHAEDCEDE